MKRSLFLGVVSFLVSSSTLAEGAEKGVPPLLESLSTAICAADPHAGHVMPAPASAVPAAAADPHAGHVMPPPAAPAPATAADPHAGHVMPAPAAAAPATAADPHAGHVMPNAGAGPAATVGQSPPPSPPSDYAAEVYYDRAAMAAARAQLREEHGGGTYSMLFFNILELVPDSDETAYRWDGEAWYGGDINRLVLKSEGEGVLDGGLEALEVQALYSRAVDPYFDLQFGIRHDIEPDPSRSYAVVSIEGLAPLYYDIEGALFLSNEGELFARASAWYDQRITQRLILQAGAELNLSGQDVRELGIGGGLSDAELGLRLRYEFRREFAPYVGVSYERKFGGTADYSRAAGADIERTSLVAGVRTWF